MYKDRNKIMAIDSNIGSMLKKNTSHMVGFEYLDKAISLKGDDLIILKKMMYYFMMGILSKDKHIKLNKIKEDTRFYITIIMNSGKGKGNLKVATLNIFKQNDLKGFKVAQIYSLHPEQLIGKTVMKKVPVDDDSKKKELKKVPVLGYFDYDLLIFEEASELFEGQKIFKLKDTNELRQSLCIAYDSPDKNIICKKLVDDEYAERIEYPAKCSAIHLTQPISFDSDVLKKGFARRNFFFQPEVNISSYDIIDFQLNGQDESPSIMANNFSIMLSDVKQNVVDSFKEWVFSEKVIKEINFLSKILVDFIKNNFKKISNKTGINTTIVPTFIKFIAVASIFTKNAPSVNVLCVKIAFVDLFEFYYESLNTQSKNIDFNYDEEVALIVSFLETMDREQKPVSISLLKSFMTKTFGISERTAIRRVKMLRENKIIATKQYLHSSFVSLIKKETNSELEKNHDCHDCHDCHDGQERVNNNSIERYNNNDIFVIYNKINEDIVDYFKKLRNNEDVSVHHVNHVNHVNHVHHVNHVNHVHHE